MHNMPLPDFAPLTQIDLPWSQTPIRWQGAALGSEVALILDAPQLQGEVAVQHAVVTLEKVCTQFNLFDETSQIELLNRNGMLTAPSEMFLDLCALATRLHVATNGLFDPTIQPLWRALFNGTAAHEARPHIGWEKVDITTGAIILQAGQKLSLNGIAQGFATDILIAALRELGITQAAIQLGERAVIGGPVDIPRPPPARRHLRDPCRRQRHQPIRPKQDPTGGARPYPTSAWATGAQRLGLGRGRGQQCRHRGRSIHRVCVDDCPRDRGRPRAPAGNHPRAPAGGKRRGP